MYDYDDYAEQAYYREDWEQQLHSLIKNVVNVKCEEVNEDNEQLKNRIDEQNKRYMEMRNEVDCLRKTVKQYEDLHSLMKLINRDNIAKVIDSLGINITNSEDYMSGMNSESISPYLKLIIKYYDNKDVVLNFLEMVDIDISQLRKFCLPRDYSKDMIKDIILNYDRRTIRTNSCYYNGNFGFWLGNQSRDLSIDRLSRVVPLQEILKSTYILELFNVIIETIKNKYDKTLFGVTKFCKFSDKQILNMSKLLNDNPKNFHSEEKDFIKRHKNILFSDNDFCDKYFSYASDNYYSIIAIHEFPKEYQIKFLKPLSFDKSMEIINRLKNEKYKKELIIAISS